MFFPTAITFAVILSSPAWAQPNMAHVRKNDLRFWAIVAISEPDRV